MHHTVPMRGFIPESVVVRPNNKALGRFIGDGAFVTVQFGGLGGLKSSIVDSMVSAVVSDLWGVLFDPSAQLVNNVSQLGFGYRFSHKIVKWLLSMDDFQKILPITRSLPLTSAQVAIKIAKSLFDDHVINNAAKNYANSASNQQQNRSGKNQSQGKGNKQNQPQNQSQGGNQQQKQQQGGDQQQNQADDDLQQTMDNIANNPLMQGMASKALDEAQKEAEKFSSTMKSYGLEQGTPTKNSFQEIKNIMSGNVTVMDVLSEMIGRFSRIGMDTLEKTVDSQFGTIADVDMTRDITRIFPLQRVYLVSDQVPPYAHSKAVAEYAAHGLIGWKKKASGMRMGSFVALIDGSDSMSRRDEVIAKALALGIAKVVMEGSVGKAIDSAQERRYALCEFSSNSQRSWISETSDPKAHMEWAAHQYRGGTDLTPAIRDMINHIQALIDDGVQGVDALIVTDSDTSVSRDVMADMAQLKKEYGTRLFYIHIEGTNTSYSYKGPLKELKEAADVMFVVRRKSVNAEGLAETADNLTVELVKSLVRTVEDLEAVGIHAKLD